MLMQVLTELNAKLEKIEGEYHTFKFNEAKVKSSFMIMFYPMVIQAQVFTVVGNGQNVYEDSFLKFGLPNAPSCYIPKSSAEVIQNKEAVDAFLVRLKKMETKFRAENLGSDYLVQSLVFLEDMRHQNFKGAIVPAVTPVYTPMLEAAPPPVAPKPKSPSPVAPKPKSAPPQEAQKGQTTEKDFGGFAKGFLK
ncbi:MAG: hypothetical protein ACHQJ6_00150 [Candidatus Berkiellales bacterium]